MKIELWWVGILCVFLCFSSIAEGEKTEGKYLIWQELPQLPSGLEQEFLNGLKGSFLGVHNGALIVAGGVENEGVWRDDIFVLEVGMNGSYHWVNRTFKLPHSLAYGVSVSTDDGVMCIGGCDGRQYFSDVFLLKWDSKREELEIEEMPSLPRPLAFMAGAKVGQEIYIAGGQERDGTSTSNFWSFDLRTSRWRELPALPGPDRLLSVAVCQNDGKEDLFYLFGGLNFDSSGNKKILTDAHCYSPKNEQWGRVTNITSDGTHAYSVAGATAAASGVNHIMIFGGADKVLLSQFMQLNDQIHAAEERNSQNRNKALTEKEINFLSNHPDLGRSILTYHTITDTWTVTEELPMENPVHTIATAWDGSFVVLSAKTHQGIREAEIWRAYPAPPPPLGAENYLVLVTYLLVLVGMGVYLSRREHTTDDYFRAGRRVPWWAVGISLFATMLSAVTYMSIPALAYATDWRRLIYNLPILMVAPVIIRLFLPFFRRLNVTTAYEYLEQRFNLLSRLLGSILFILLQLGRMGVVIFLPALLLSTATGISIYFAILVMGIISIFYTTLGGIEGVIWSDVIQAVILMGGALLCISLIVLQTEGGIPMMIDIAQTQNKLRTFDFSFDFTTDVFWVCLIGGFAANLISYGSDQTQIQRYLTTKDEKSAAKSIWTNGILSIVPSSVTFFALGTALFVFYKMHPQSLNPTMSSVDAIFPWYIITALPTGVSGLLIAGIFAAAMSSLDSSMNSVSAAIVTDFYRRFKSKVDEHACLRFARWVTVVTGVVGVVIALIMASSGPMYMWDQFIAVVGLFGGGLCGIFLLGILTRKANGAGAIAGLIISGSVQYMVMAHTQISVLLYSLTGMVSCVIVGYFVSIIFHNKRKSIDGLTIYTLNKVHKRGVDEK